MSLFLDVQLALELAEIQVMKVLQSRTQLNFRIFFFTGFCPKKIAGIISSSLYRKLTGNRFIQKFFSALKYKEYR